MTKMHLRTRVLLGLVLLCAGNTNAQHGDPATKAALAGLEPAPGLKVELFASDPLLFNPVAFTIDEGGRFFIAESHRWKDSIFDLWSKDGRWKLADFSFTTVEQREAFLRAEFATNLTLLTKDSEIIRLVEDKNGDGIADSSRVFADGFNKVTSGTAAGILASEGQLWFTCIPDLSKFTYSAEGKAITRDTLHTGYGVRTSVSGHDLHGLARGLDGRIYFSVGDRGANVLSKEGVQLENANSGAVFRCEPDGSKLEIFATGLRNPQELAFDVFGNLWTHDNDTGGEDPPRVLHVVEGGDYGWRQSYQFMEGFGPWVKEKVWEGKLDDVLPFAGVGAQGPSGLATYPGTGLPAKYNGALLACDFPQGVWTYFLHPKGASYELKKERFLWALGPTDVDFGPDGHVYISDWGRSYAMPGAGRLLRVRSETTNSNVTDLSKLLNGGIQSAATEQLPALLAHADMRVRTAAQFALENRKATKQLELVARDSTNQFARIHAVWALGNLKRRDNHNSEETLFALIKDRDPEIRAQAANQLGEFSDSQLGSEALVALLQDASPRVQMFAAQSLGRKAIKDPAISEALLQLAGRTADQDPFVRHAVIHALTRLNHGAEILKAAHSSNAHIRRVVALCWRRQGSKQLQMLLTDPDPAVRRDAARAINDVGITNAFAKLALHLKDSEHDPQILIRAINGNFRLGQGEEWFRTLRFAVESSAHESMRVEALSALGQWSKPSPLDRVVGLWRPIPGVRRAGPPSELAHGLVALLEHASTNIVLAALNCAEQTSLTQLAPTILKQLENKARPDAVRVKALNVLGKLSATNLTPAVQLAFDSGSSPLKAEAVTWLPKVAPESGAGLIQKILESEKDIRIQQNAIAALGQLPGEPARSLLAKVGEELLSGHLKPELQLDVVEAFEAAPETPLKSRVKQWHSGATSSDSLGTYRWAMAGGNAEAGKKVFTEKDAVGCLRCHAIKGQGGIVGPDLAGVATRLDRRLLLESIVHPNAKISTGYESVSITRKDGSSVAGTVKSETDSELEINSPEDGIIRVKKTDIEERTKTLSPMPEGLAALMTGRELRDLLEYVATLK